MRERTHFMLLRGVRAPNMPAWFRMAMYAASENSLVSEAVPKYFLPAAFAVVSRPEPEGGGEPPEGALVG